MTSREIYQLFHNKTWIEGLEGQEIAYYDVDNLENHWCLYKPKYTTAANDSNRLQTQKNRKGDLLVRKKNRPIGFKLCDATETDIDATGAKYQAQVTNQTLREVLDGNIYEFKLYGNYGVVFGVDLSGDFYSICFQVDGFVRNSNDEEFISLSVVSTNAVSSLYNFVDCLIYNNNFYTIEFDGSSQLTTTKFNISFGVSEGSKVYTFSTTSFNATSENDLTSLEYTPVASRIITISATPTETIGRIWTTTYSDSEICLAYECDVPTARSSVTGVTEGIALLKMSIDSFLETTTGTFEYYVYDNLVDISKVADLEYCQCFIPDYTDEQQSFGHSLTIDGDNLIVGSPEEDAVYVFDLTDTDTPDLFGSPPTTLPTNGIKLQKDYSLEHTPVFPVRLTGYMNFEIFGDVDILWRYPDGTMSTGALATGYVSGVDTYYLFCDNFLNGDVRIHAGNTTGYLGDLNDIPNLSFEVDVSNTMASGHFGNDFQATSINIENTNVSQADLEASAIVLDEAGNVSGTLTAKQGLPNIVSPDGVAAINALKAKAWNVSVNMPFDDIDPAFTIAGAPVSGTIDTFSVLSEDPLGIYGVPTSGAIEYIIPDQIFVTGAFTSAVDGYYSVNGSQNSHPKWTKDTSPFNDIEFNTQWDIMHEIPVSGTYYTNPGTDYLVNKSGWVPGDVGQAPAPTLDWIYF